MPKSFLRAVGAVLFAVFALYSLVLVPAYEIIASDIMLLNTLWFDAVDLLMQWVEAIALCLILAFLAVGVYQSDSLAACKPLFVLTGAALLFKYLGAILALSVVHGSFDVTLNYGSYLVALLLELIPAILVAFLAHRLTEGQRAREAECARAAAVLGVTKAPTAPLLPLSSPFAKGNALQSILYLGVGVATAIRLVAFIAADIAYSMLGFAYRLSDIPVTLLYALILVLIPAFIGYLLLFFTVQLSAKKYFK